MIVLQSPENKKNTIRLFKVSRELNVGVTTLVDFAQKMGYVVESSPNTNISSELYQVLLKRFSKKKEPKDLTEEKNKDKKPYKINVNALLKLLKGTKLEEVVNSERFFLSESHVKKEFDSHFNTLNQLSHSPTKQFKFLDRKAKNARYQVIDLLDKYYKVSQKNIVNNQFTIWAIEYYEEYNKYEEAINLTVHCLHIRFDIKLLIIALRLCRKLKNNYKILHNIIRKYHKQIEETENFHLLHSLVYYYIKEKNQEALTLTLIKIEKQAVNSLTIQTILKDIYIYLQRFDDAIRVSQKIPLNNSEFSVELMDSSKDSIEKIRENIQTELIKQLIKGFSHELGQPITAIRYTIQYYQRLLAKEFSQEKVMEVFNIILDETSRMDSLIKTLRPITSSNATATTYNLLSLIDERLKAQQAQLLTYDIQVKVQSKGLEVLELKGDLPQMEQVINNLLLNAIDALSVLPTTKPKSITISIQSFDNYFVYLNFADNGIGIPETIKDKIFTAFYSTKSPDKGQGLGLFIVKNLLQSIGGDIQLMTNHIEGACFQLKIPRNSKPL